MNRLCVICKILISAPTLKTKYCTVCAKNQQRIRSNNWSRKNITRKEYDLFCLDCNDSLPVGCKGDKKYCKECLRDRIRFIHNNHALSKRKKEKLNKFYKNIRINLIQSPYLVEKTLLNNILLVK